MIVCQFTKWLKHKRKQITYKLILQDYLNLTLYSQCLHKADESKFLLVS